MVENLKIENIVIIINHNHKTSISLFFTFCSLLLNLNND